MKIFHKGLTKYTLLLTTSVILCIPAGNSSFASECTDSASEGRICSGATDTEGEAPVLQERESSNIDDSSNNSTSGNNIGLSSSGDTVRVLPIFTTDELATQKAQITEIIEGIHPDLREEVKNLMVALSINIAETMRAEGASSEEIAERMKELLQSQSDEINKIAEDALEREAELEAVLEDEKSTLEEIEAAREELKALEEETQAQGAQAAQNGYGDMLKGLLGNLLGGGQQQQQNPGAPTDFSPSSPGALPDSLTSKKDKAKNSVDEACKTKTVKNSPKIKVKIKVAEDPKKKQKKKEKRTGIREKSKSIFHTKRDGWNTRWGAKLILASTEADEKSSAEQKKKEQDTKKTKAPEVSGDNVGCAYSGKGVEVGTVIGITVGKKYHQCTVNKKSSSGNLEISSHTAKYLGLSPGATAKGEVQIVATCDTDKSKEKEDNSSTSADFGNQKIAPKNGNTWDSARDKNELLRPKTLDQKWNRFKEVVDQ